jgi:hypothetical protein
MSIMKHVFNINLTADVESTLLVVARYVRESGGTFSGDCTTGEFSGSGVVGSYHITGLVATINILKKPMLAPMMLVESKIRSYFRLF